MGSAVAKLSPLRPSPLERTGRRRAVRTPFFARYSEKAHCEASRERGSSSSRRTFRTRSPAPQRQRTMRRNAPPSQVYCKGTVRTRFWRHLLCALPFIVFAIRRYCCILFTAKHLKIYSPKVRSNQKLRFCPQTRQGPQAVPSARSRALTQYRGKIRAFDRVPIIPLQYKKAASPSSRARPRRREAGGGRPPRAKAPETGRAKLSQRARTWLLKRSPSFTPKKTERSSALPSVIPLRATANTVERSR